MNVAILDYESVRAVKMQRSLCAAGYACQIYRNSDRFIDTVDARITDILLFSFDGAVKSVLPIIVQAKEKGLKKILLLAKTLQTGVISEALFAGADDYLCLPLRQHELQMRISVLARQIVPDARAHVYLEQGGFVFCKYPNDLKLRGKSIRLTAKEFDLSLLFFRHLGMPLSRAHIADAVWKMDGSDMVRTIDTHVSRIRNKLNLRPGNGFFLEQIYGFGYQLHAMGEK